MSEGEMVPAEEAFLSLCKWFLSRPADVLFVLPTVDSDRELLLSMVEIFNKAAFESNAPYAFRVVEGKYLEMHPGLRRVILAASSTDN